MDEATRSAWCREQGLYPAELDAWKRDAIAGLGEPRAASAVEARQDRRRVKELERELHRKDKALAETAALLVLSKRMARPVCKRFLRSDLISLRQRIRPVSIALAKMEIRASRSS